MLKQVIARARWVAHDVAPASMFFFDQAKLGL